MGNLKVTLRRCRDDADVASTYTFPAGETEEKGDPRVFNAEYLQEILDRDYYSGGKAEEVAIGMYSFQILPNMIPGEYYVLFESPRGYRLTNGGGREWEVGVELKEDTVFPMMMDGDGRGRGSPGGRRGLQSSLEDGVGVDADGAAESSSDETIAGPAVDDSNGGVGGEANETMTDTATNENNSEQSIATKRPTPKPTSYEGYIPEFEDFINSFDLDAFSSDDLSDVGPITHSGYFSRSKCISINTNPILIEEINAGMSEATWPLSTFQYASFVLTLSFYEQSEGSAIYCSARRQQRRRQLQKDTLECRKYAKMKAEGIPVDDVWGCETEVETGISVDEFVKLTLEQVSTMTYHIQY